MNFITVILQMTKYQRDFTTNCIDDLPIYECIKTRGWTLEGYICLCASVWLPSLDYYTKYTANSKLSLNLTSVTINVHSSLHTMIVLKCHKTILHLSDTGLTILVCSWCYATSTSKQGNVRHDYSYPTWQGGLSQSKEIITVRSLTLPRSQIQRFTFMFMYLFPEHNKVRYCHWFVSVPVGFILKLLL